MTGHIGRRELITLLGGAAVARPLTAPAQQPAMPVIGFLRSATAAGSAHLVTAFRQALNEAGFVEGRTSRSSTAGLTIKTIDCQRWHPISFAVR